MFKKIIDKFIVFRKKLIKYVLHKSNFILITGHWVYAPMINNQPVVFDLGGNLGQFSVEMKKRFNAFNYLFEANENLCKTIDNNVGVVFNLAVSDKCGIEEFLISENHEASSFNPRNLAGWRLNSKQKVQTIDWHEMLILTGNSDKVIDLVKIDIEGAEINFLNNLTREQLLRIKSLTVEFHDWLDNSLHKPTLDVINRLRAFGFITITDAPNHSWPVEMCFINKNFLNLRLNQKLWLKLYQLIKF